MTSLPGIDGKAFSFIFSSEMFPQIIFPRTAHQTYGKFIALIGYHQVLTNLGYILSYYFTMYGAIKYILHGQALLVDNIERERNTRFTDWEAKLNSL